MTAPLPESQRKRYTIRRKANLVAEVMSGLITAEFAMRKHEISPEEWAEWLRKYAQWKGLRITKREKKTEE